MAQFLQLLLGAQEPMFGDGLRKLEKSTGESGIDTRLIADVTEKAHALMRRLELDVCDTTGEELYYALNSAVRRSVSRPLFSATDYVLFVAGGQVVSLNLIDAIENSHHEMPFGRRIVTNGRKSLQNELVSRYAKHARTNEATTYAIARSIGLILENGS